MPAAVAAAYDAFPASLRTALMPVRDRILALSESSGVGPMTEALKWGQPSYLTEATRAGTTIRLGATGGRPAVFVNCRTTIVERLRAEFPGALDLDGTRAILIDGCDPALLDICLLRALTNHRAKRTGSP